MDMAGRDISSTHEDCLAFSSTVNQSETDKSIVTRIWVFYEDEKSLLDVLKAPCRQYYWDECPRELFEGSGQNGTLHSPT